MMDRMDLQKRFAYHKPPNERVAKVHELIRGHMGETANAVLAHTPECRERSLAITKLEEAMMWANAAVARNHEHYVPTEALEGSD